MAARQVTFSPYETGGAGVGGKSRKPLHKRSHTTPYDRPLPSSLRNPPPLNDTNSHGWISKIVNPASKLITSSAHRLFSTVFRKRLLPPPQPQSLPQQPPPPAPRDADVEPANQHDEADPVVHPPQRLEKPLQEQDVGHLSNNSNHNEVSELEQILKQKTFSRSEIDHLTALLQSRTVDSTVLGNGNGFVKILPEAVTAHGNYEAHAYVPSQQNGLGSQRLLGEPSTPVGRSQAVDKDVVSPTELAKAYMGSRPSKVSPSMLALRAQAHREDSPVLRNSSFNSNSSALTLVPKFSARSGPAENGLVTPRSLGRSAIYNMARTPYSKMLPSTSKKDSVFRSHGDPSASLSPYSSERNRSSGPSEMTLKRRSSVFDNDIGSIGPIRRIRQKPNLLSSKNFHAPVSVNVSAGSKSQGEKEDNDARIPSFAPVPDQSSAMAQKIMLQLDKLVPSPKGKSSEPKLGFSKGKSASTLTTEMLSGPALRSLEKVDSIKFLDNVQDDSKLVSSIETKLDGAQDLYQNQGTVDAYGPKRSLNSILSKGSDVKAPKKDAVLARKTGDSGIMDVVSHPALKRRGFQMSAHEDYLDIDEDGFSNGTVATSLAEEGKSSRSALGEKKSFPFKDAILVHTPVSTGEKPKMLVEEKPSFTVGEKPPVTVGEKPAVTVGEKPPVTVGEKPAVTVGEKPPANVNDGEHSVDYVVADKSSGSMFSISSPSGTIEQTLPAQPPPFIDSALPPKQSAVASPIFSFTAKNADQGSDKAPPFMFTSASGQAVAKPTFSSDTKLDSSSSDIAAAASADNKLKMPDSFKNGNAKDVEEGKNLLGRTETAPSSAPSTLTTNLFSFGSSAINGFSNGSVAPTSLSFSSPIPAMSVSDAKDQEICSANTASASTSNATLNNSVASRSNNVPFSFASSPSFSTVQLRGFGSAASSFAVPVETSGVVQSDTDAKAKKETVFGKATTNPFGVTSSAATPTGGSLFGLTAATSAANSQQSQETTSFGSGVGSLGGGQASPFSTGLVSVSQSTSAVQFSSSAPTFSFSASTSTGPLFNSSSPATQVFGSGLTFGLNASSSSGTNSVSSTSGTTTNLFGSVSQASQPSFFGSASNSSAAPSFSFGSSSTSLAAPSNAPAGFGSSTTTSAAPLFSFNSAAASATPSKPLSSAQPVFGSSTPIFPAFSSASSPTNNDPMGMEDTMAEDAVHSTTPSVPVFGQPQSFSSTIGANPFQFGSTAQSGVSTFQFGNQANPAAPVNQFGNQAAPVNQFGNQANPATPVNQSPFQGAGSLDLGAGGSFSLGSTGGDKSGRKIVKVKRNQRRRP